jgi:hypothetical protein
VFCTLQGEFLGPMDNIYQISRGIIKKTGWRGAKVSKAKEAGLRRIPLQPASSL